MNATRRLSIAALAVACLHLVFGAIVRISGSGMGCGDHWPKCYGRWFPPFDRPDLIVEVSHRYLASILTLAVLSMALAAWRNRRVPGIGGKGGAMRSAFGAVAAVFSAAILGGVTVKMGNAPWATVAHWLVAMTLLAMVAMTAIRSGALGGASSLVQRGSQRARRSAFAAALLAIFAVALGGLTAKYPGAAVGCTTVPMCGPNPSVETASVHVQLTHRTLAVLLVLHLIGVVMMVRKRRAEEAPVVVRAAYIALGMVLLQLVVASAMVLFHLPPVLRSLHEATGVGIWLSCFTLAYLARRASNVTPPEPATLPDPSPKGGRAIVDEPVGAPSVIPASETIVASAPVTPFAAEEIVEIAEEETGPSVAAVVEDDVAFEDEAVAANAAADEAIVLAELILAIEDAAKEAALERAEAVAIEAALAAAVASEARASAAIPSEAKDLSVAEEVVDVAEELAWEPHRAEAEELDEFSIAALEAEVAALEAAQVEEIAPVVEAAVAEPIEQVTAESNVVAPPVKAPTLSPITAPTMAVLVARGADFL